MENFQNDLLKSVRQMKAGKAARVTAIKVPAVTDACDLDSPSQSEFAKRLGVPFVPWDCNFKPAKFPHVGPGGHLEQKPLLALRT